ncbi:hypothetical protein Tco_0504402, partial [Tanacetum coccineum]
MSVLLQETTLSFYSTMIRLRDSSIIHLSKENDDLFDLECKTNDEAECFNLAGDNDEIDAFLAIEVPTYIE